MYLIAACALFYWASGIFDAEKCLEPCPMTALNMLAKALSLA
jgi:hypothetical protein